MASEDSRNRDRPRRFIMLCDESDPTEPLLREVRALLHHPENGRERHEVSSLGGDQWVLLEERHDHRGQLAPTLHGEAQKRVTMVVMALILDDLSAPEDSLDELECEPRRCGLGDREAAFAVNEPDYPLLDAWPFLLIVRTGRIVTVHFHTLYDEVRQTVPPDPRGFQHIADCTRHVAVSRGSAWCTPGFYLSTVIVTAAVYWRLGSELRPASRANPSP